MDHAPTSWPGRRRLAYYCVGYGLFILYASTIIGPSGIHFVSYDPAQVFRRFLATPYVLNGSDQRADWMGNLLMLVPFGFLLTGALWPKRMLLKAPAAVLALAISVLVILIIKYLQLFFPPRTVTLNYIAAQAAGAAIGCATYAAFWDRIARSVSRQDPASAFTLALRLYVVALVIFLLMPLDFALDAADLQGQIDRLPEAMAMLPGGNRSPAVRAVLVGVAAAAFIPVGMLLTFARDCTGRSRRGIRAITGLGLLITSGIFALTTLVISGYPVLGSVAYRTGGILIGAMTITWLTRQDPALLRRRFRRLAPWLVVPYAALLLVVNSLLSTHWLSMQDAFAQLHRLGMLPLFNYYIVTKAQAAKSIAGHGLLYAPIGVLLWMRYGNMRAGRVFLAASLVACLVEAARYFRPELQGDINTVVLAGLAAMLGGKLMSWLWPMLEAQCRTRSL